MEARRVTFAAAAVVTALAAWTATRLAAVVLSEPGLPLWDAAGHGIVGVEVARAVRAVNLPAFLAALNSQVLWPFVHSLMLAPAFLLWGTRPEVGDLVSTALFAGTALAVFAAGVALHPRRGVWIGALAAVLLLLSPLYRFFATTTMLEMPGAFLLACALALHARCEREAPPRGLVIAAGIATTALFLCKYNYGLLWLVPLAAFECGLLDRERRREMLQSAWIVLRGGRLARPLPLFLLAWLAVMLVVLATGGTELTLAGRHVSVRSPGNMAYVFLLELCGLALVSWRRHPAAARARWRALSERHRLLILTVAVPLAVWFLIPYPNRVKEFFGFVINRSEGAPAGLFDRLLFYPRAFAHDYSPHTIMGAAVFLLALLPMPTAGPRRAELSLLRFALGVGLLSELVHHYQQTRFLFTTAPLIWLCASLNAVALIERCMKPLERRPAAREGAWALALTATLAWGWLGAPPLTLTRAQRRAFQSPIAFAAVPAQVVATSGGGTGRTWLLGYGNRLSPALIRWHAAMARPAGKLDEVPARLPWLLSGATEAAIAARMQPLLAPGSRVISALPVAGCPLYSVGEREEVWADSVTAERLAAMPGVLTESDTLLAAVGFRVRGFRLPGEAVSR